MPADDSQAWLMSFDHLGHMADQDRITLVLGHDDVADIVELSIDVFGPVGDPFRLEGVDPFAQ